MSWLSEALHDIEKHTIRPVVSKTIDVAEDVWESPVGKVAVLAGGGILAAPLILPVLSTVGSVGAGVVSGAGSLVGGAVKGVGSLFGGPAVTTIADIPAGSTVAELGLPASTITGAIGSPGLISSIGGILGSIGKVAVGTIDTLAHVLPKTGQIINTIEGVLGHEDQPTVDIRDTPAGDAPSSSSPVINLTIPPQSTGGIVLTTPPAAEQSNTMLYAGLAIAAIMILKGR